MTFRSVASTASSTSFGGASQGLFDNNIIDLITPAGLLIPPRFVFLSSGLQSHFSGASQADIFGFALESAKQRAVMVSFGNNAVYSKLHYIGEVRIGSFLSMQI
eukprot:TRINITY_DN156_c0_g1_i8.p1 TRINITY_DN156_c0_g1~~TRINITY_DN156_c0_g1_i8.p1  ORF type:complete len:104 (+),score=18.86 TRINITY_DN156_c0_g1_i8:1168-1479(+)